MLPWGQEHFMPVAVAKGRSRRRMAAEALRTARPLLETSTNKPWKGLMSPSLDSVYSIHVTFTRF